METAGASNAIVRATGSGFLRGDRTVLTPFLERYFAELNPIWESRSYHIASEILEGFFPTPLIGVELRDASQAWLDANASASPALRRIVIENLAGVDRALAAQTADRA